MASVTRYFSTGEYYHVYDRGNHQEAIYRDRDDRRYFLAKLDEFAERDRIAVLAYCLMTNHYHLLLRQDGDIPVSHMMQSLKAGFVKTYNAKYGLVGRLFQDRYGMRRIRDSEDLLYVSRYIHRNPEVIQDYRSYQWSSVSEYMDRRVGFCDPQPVLEIIAGMNASYDTFLETTVSPGEPVSY